MSYPQVGLYLILIKEVDMRAETISRVFKESVIRLDNSRRIYSLIATEKPQANIKN